MTRARDSVVGAASGVFIYLKNRPALVGYLILFIVVMIGFVRQVEHDE